MPASTTNQVATQKSIIDGFLKNVCEMESVNHDEAVKLLENIAPQIALAREMQKSLADTKDSTQSGILSRRGSDFGLLEAVTGVVLAKLSSDVKSSPSHAQEARNINSFFGGISKQIDIELPTNANCNPS